MSMLKAFFEIGADKSLFDGLEISKEKKCDAYQGQYPVLFLSLKGIDGETFDEAMKAMAELLSAECQRISALLDTEKISEFDRERLDKLIKMDADVYCPWDVVNHCDKLLQSPDAEPELYWDNTSSNEIIRGFIENADVATRKDIERLIAGEALEKRLVLNFIMKIIIMR